MQKIVFIDLDKYLEFIREWIKLLQSVTRVLDVL